MNNSLKKILLRILEISYNNKLSHIGSCITAAPIIYDIYNNKKENDIFVLSAGHAYLAQLVVMEHFGLVKNAEEISLKDGTHPKRDLKNKISLSTGSLGMGLPVCVGFALAAPQKQIHCLISDGELAEGSIWESLHFIKNYPSKENKFNPISNLFIYVNANGYSALKETSNQNLKEELKIFSYNMEFHNTSYDSILNLLKGLEAHYQVLTEEKYKEIKNFYESL